MRWEYLLTNHRREYIRLLLDGKLNEYLHEVDEGCHARVEVLVEQMKAGTGITEELKSTNQMKWMRKIKTFGFSAKSKLLLITSMNAVF